MRLAAALLVLVSGTLYAGQMGGFEAPAVRAKGHVTYAAEPESVAAGREGWVELHFAVDAGYHVNSHAPKSELLIATEVTLEPAVGVRVGKLEYPAGVAYSFPADPGDVLDVYTGAFRVRVPVEARAGEHTLTGVLRYQACDKAACYPPRTLPVTVLFTAR